MHDGRDEDELSMCLARFVTGENRLFSAVCWERRWTSLSWFALHWVVNRHFYRLHGAQTVRPRFTRSTARQRWPRRRIMPRMRPGPGKSTSATSTRTGAARRHDGNAG